VNGIHDLGGMDGFGQVCVEAGEPVFHAPWERVVFGLTVAVLGRGIGNSHAYRHGIERMEPSHYLLAPYYERMLTGVATMLVEHGIVTREELDTRVPGGFPLGRPAIPPRLEPVLQDGTLDSVAAPAGSAKGTRGRAGPDGARFARGDRVRVRNVETPGHTRCPRYVRGKHGEIVRVDPRFSLPDLEAHTGERRREYTYGVRFAAAELWGAAAGDGETIHVDLWESYLEPDGPSPACRSGKPPEDRRPARRGRQRTR
jgi:nitrile hydratase subunit beta